MKGRRVFVSGGAGVIGLELVPKLVERGAEVLVGDLKPRPQGFAAEVRYRQGDLNTLTQADAVARNHAILERMEAALEKSDWLVDDRYSLADITSNRGALVKLLSR